VEQAGEVGKTIGAAGGVHVIHRETQNEIAF